MFVVGEREMCGLLAETVRPAVQELSLTGLGNVKRLVCTVYKSCDFASVCVSI